MCLNAEKLFEMAKTEGIKDFTKYQDWIQVYVEKLKYQSKYASGQNVKSLKDIKDLEVRIKKKAKHIFVVENHF